MTARSYMGPIQPIQTVWFAGLSTRGSLAFQVFPAWAAEVGVRARLDGIDLPPGAPAERYRAFVRDLRSRQHVVGAVVTAHKVALFESARDELDDVDALAMLCREISVLRWEGSRLIGCAIEPRSVALTLQRMVPPGHWTATGGELLIFGAGGTAAALLASFYSRVAQGPDAPSTVHLVDTRSARANALRDSVLRWRPAVSVITADAGRSAEVVAGLPPGSLIVNATGLGKDTPGSPVPLPARWPQKAVFWDLNYRGDLPMLADARQAAERRSLRVYDGWTLFIEGWAEALGLIFGRRSTAEDRAILERAALSVQS